MIKQYKVIKVTKPAQGNTATRIIKPRKKVYEAKDPTAAAKKMMTRLCKNKRIYGRCALKIKFIQVKKRKINGKSVLVPILKKQILNNGKVVLRPKIYLKRLRLKAQSKNVVFTSSDGKKVRVTFKKQPVVVNSV